MTLIQTEPKAIKLGTTDIKKVYLGTNQVRPKVYPYLCFTANAAGSTVTLNKSGSPTSVTLETSTNGTTWSTYTIGNTITLSNVGDKVYFRNTSTTTTGFSTSSSKFYVFAMSGSIAASGDVTYLLNKNGTTTLSGNYCFYDLFGSCTSLTTSPKTPATQLTQYCYASMFQGCSNLTTINNIPAANSDGILPPRACQEMYRGCTKIKISLSQTGEYQTEYRIPTTGDLAAGTYSLNGMFMYTGGSWTGTPTINTTYYTSNTVV